MKRKREADAKREAEATREDRAPLVERRHAPRSERTARWTTVILTVLALLCVAGIIWSFAWAMFVAAVLAAAFEPGCERFTRRMGGRRVRADGLVTVAVMVVVVIPVASLTVVLAREAADGVAYV